MKEDWFAGLAPVVQKMDSTIHRISIRETNCTFQWIVLSTFSTTGTRRSKVQVVLDSYWDKTKTFGLR